MPGIGVLGVRVRPEPFLSGDIDEVRLVIGRALTDAEITAIYEAGPTGTCAPPS